jgi:hypothetical protein
MAGGIIKTGEHQKVVWELAKAHFEAAYSPEFKDLFAPTTPRKPPTRWQRFKYPFKEAYWRVQVAFDVLRHGDESEYLRNDYY